MRFINDFFTGKSAEKRRHNETQSTNEDKDGDNSSHLNNDKLCT